MFGIIFGTFLSGSDASDSDPVADVLFLLGPAFAYSLRLSLVSSSIIHSVNDIAP